MTTPLQEKEAIYIGVASSASLRDATYWAEILFAAGIATLGLVLNSPAVIIGAMLISPLMGPIMAGGLALAAGDFVLAARSFTSTAISSLMAIFFSTVLVTLLPFREMTSEIAARTSPNTLDLGVALFSGAVGAIAIAKQVRGIATSIPGVAIAVALMPPLCVVGYGVGVFLTLDRAQGESVVRGGGLLFLTNLIAITFASMLVFLALRIDDDQIKERIREWRQIDPEQAAFSRIVDRIPMPKSVARIGSRPGRVVLAAAFLAVIAVPLTNSFIALRDELTRRQSESAIQRAATRVWQRSFAAMADGTPRSYIDTLATRENASEVEIDLRVFTSRGYTVEERTRFEREVAFELGRSMEQVDVNLTEIPTSRFEVATRAVPAEPPPAPPKPRTFRQLADDLAQRTAGAIATLALPPGVTITGHSVGVDSLGPVITISYTAEADISADAHTLITAALQRAVEDPRLRVTLVRTLPPAATTTTTQT